jgi:hypothetical protein
MVGALYTGVAWATLMSGVALALGQPGDPGSMSRSAVLVLVPVMVFYSAILVFMKKLAESRARRWWFGACAIVSLILTVLSSLPGGAIVFGPATVALAVAAVLAPENLATDI